MLLQLIVAELDAELQRLQELRHIVDGISSISPLDGLSMELSQLQQPRLGIMPPPETVTQPDLSKPLTALPPKSRFRGKLPESRALASTIPATPVVVHAAQVASERQRRVPPKSGGTGKRKTAALPVHPRPDAAPSVEALRRRWLATD